jgi:hypothetical protein
VGEVKSGLLPPCQLATSEPFISEVEKPMSFDFFGRVRRTRLLASSLIVLLCGCAKADDSDLYRMVLKNDGLSVELCAPRKYTDHVTRAINGAGSNAFEPWGLRWRDSQVGGILDVVPLDKSKVRKLEGGIPHIDDFIQISYDISEFNNAEPASDSPIRRYRAGKLVVDNVKDQLDLFEAIDDLPRSDLPGDRPLTQRLMPKSRKLALRYWMSCHFDDETRRRHGDGRCSLRTTTIGKLALNVSFGEGWLVHWHELAEAVERHTESLRNACLKG